MKHTYPYLQKQLTKKTPSPSPLHPTQGNLSETTEQRTFKAQLQSYTNRVRSYEDQISQAISISLIPETLTLAAKEAAELSNSMGDHPPLSYQDALSLELLSWFKRDFFKWVNSPSCDICGSSTRSCGVTTTPSPEEAAYEATIVEIYQCLLCSAIFRFPRYNDPVKLLETREGRCGEWANAFALCCRAMGLRVRLVLELGDHVWVEIYSEQQERWIHYDPCEGISDKPLLYEKGWGKEIAYCIAIGIEGVVDVTKRYVAPPPANGGGGRRMMEVEKRRTMFPDSWLQAVIQQTTDKLRQGMTDEEKKILMMKDSKEATSLVGQIQLSRIDETAAAATQQLPGRMTGSADWVAARGEGGGGRGGGQGGKAATMIISPLSVRYRWAKGAMGGACRASGENAPNETVEMAFDGSFDTKWLDFGKVGTWLEYRLPKEKEPVVVAKYSLVSGNDEPDRDPSSWVLQAWQEEGEEDEEAGENRRNWVVIDEQLGLKFQGRKQRLEFVIGVKERVLSRQWRLVIKDLRDEKVANSVQLCCLDLCWGVGVM